jgi:RNA polymerase sigma-70 factor (ECF subfamily)
MDTLWRTAFERGGQSWPGVELRYEGFSERLQQLGYEQGALPEHVDALYVCTACSLGDEAACRAIEERHFPGLRAALARIDGRKDFLDEVLQLLRVHLFSGPAPKIASYTGRGPLSRWLKTAAMRIAFRQKKARAIHVTSMPDSPDPAAAPTVVSRRDDSERPFQSAYARAFEQALREAFGGLHGRERAVLRLHFAEGMNIDEIGRVYAVHRATVARWLASSREGLARTVRGRLEAQFGQLTQDEFDSLFRLVYEQLDLSVTALLRNSVQFAGIAAAELASERSP